MEQDYHALCAADSGPAFIESVAGRDEGKRWVKARAGGTPFGAVLTFRVADSSWVSKGRDFKLYLNEEPVCRL